MRIKLWRTVFVMAIAFMMHSGWNVAHVAAKAWLASGLIDVAWQRSIEEGGRVKPWRWADIWPVAKLRVPQLEEEHIVLSADHGNALAFGPGIHPASRLPGDQGVTLISAHRDTHFNFLKELTIGQEIQLETHAGVFIYQVVETMVVDADTLISSDALDSDTLVLSTCYPFDAVRADDQKRFLVVAVQN